MSSEALQERVKEKFGALSARDRILLVAMVLIIIGTVGYLVIKNANSKLAALEAETAQYREALNYINDNQAAYQKNVAQKEAMRKKLVAADAKIVSKLSSMASSLGFDVTVTPKDAKKTSDDSGTEEQEIEVTFKGVDYDKFLQYIIQINKLESPVYMRHLSINRTSNNNTSDTKMTVSITLMSYRLKEQNAT